MAQNPNSKQSDSGSAKGAKGAKGDNGDDKKKQAALEEVGKIADKLEKQLDKVNKLIEQAGKKDGADDKVMKSLVDGMQDMSKMMETMDKSAKALSKNIG